MLFHHWLQPTVTEATIDVGEDHQSKEQVGFIMNRQSEARDFHPVESWKDQKPKPGFKLQELQLQQSATVTFGQGGGEVKSDEVHRTLDSQCFNNLGKYF